ncbi:hypothetical protein F4775DRAFT_270270 [Biscogniauxia sp. FL1348]|nr:hypothetical protein F4775DRAFT_270270 [Biscogniauxia sp. FL1348]
MPRSGRDASTQSLAHWMHTVHTCQTDGLKCFVVGGEGVRFRDLACLASSENRASHVRIDSALSMPSVRYTYSLTPPTGCVLPTLGRYTIWTGPARIQSGKGGGFPGPITCITPAGACSVSPEQDSNKGAAIASSCRKESVARPIKRRQESPPSQSVRLPGDIAAQWRTLKITGVHVAVRCEVLALESRKSLANRYASPATGYPLPPVY